MARSFIVYQGEDELPEFDLTEATDPVHVIWPEIEAGGRAFRGEQNTSSIPVRDEQAQTGNPSGLPSGLDHVSLSRGSRWVWMDGPDGAEVIMASGRIGTKDYSRGRQPADRAREVIMQCGDRNEELTQIIVDDWVRGEETDVERVLALRTDYLNGSPRVTTVLADTYVDAGNTVTMPAKTYDGTNPKDILAEIATFANKNFFVTIDDELWYDINESTSYLAGLRISDRPDEWTTEESSAGPTTTRLYFSAATAASAGDPEPTVSGEWEQDDTGQVNVWTTSPDSSFGTTSAVNTSIGGAAGGRDVCIWRAVYGPLSSDEAAAIAAGGQVFSGQVRGRARFGIGISEASQDMISQAGVRVTVGNSTSIRGTALALHTLASSSGSAKWPAQSTRVNRAVIPAASDGTLSAVPGTAAGDYLVIEVGVRNFTTVTSGSNMAITSDQASDLPLDETTTTALNSWVQWGPSEEAVLTFPPKWDVGPASTEDGLELVSGLRLYYGQDGAYVYVNDVDTEDQYWHAERSFYTQDPAINSAPEATTLAEAILHRLRFEERTYNVSVGPLYPEHVHLLKPGQLVDIKARAISDADDAFVSRRIAQLRWTTPRPGVFWARMQLDRPIKDQPYGVGAKAGHDALEQHKEGDSHPASAITIIDAGTYFTGTDVEAALQELGASAGVTDHGALTGLADDDHPQYLTEAEAAAAYGLPHSHPDHNLEAFELSASPDGGTIWFNAPGAIHYEGVTYYGYVDSSGNVCVRAYTHATGVVGSEIVLHAALEVDDHNNPAFLIRDSDKKLMCFYSAHVEAQTRMRISTTSLDTDPDLGDGFAAEVNLDAQIGLSNYSYAQPVQLTGEANDPIYLFLRSGTGNGSDWYYSKSTDGGATWGAGVKVFDEPSQWAYLRVVPNGDDRIDFAASTSPAQGADVDTAHFYYQGSAWHQSDGTAITLPLDLSDMTLVHDGATEETSWIWDIAIGLDGQPRIAYVTYPTTTDHRYRYARWTGSEWVTAEVCAAGENIDSSDLSLGYYSGGIAIDRLDPARVWASRQVGSAWEIFTYTTPDGGATWEEDQITADSATKNVRPVAVYDAAPELRVTWMRGTYVSLTNWTTATWGAGLTSASHTHDEYATDADLTAHAADPDAHHSASSGAGGAILLESGHAVPFTFDEILQESDGSDFLRASE